MEILEDKTQPMPIRNEHIHLSLAEAEIPKAQAWYAKTFGGKPGTRNNAPIVDLPGVQIRFVRADTKQAPTRGRVLDHIGFADRGRKLAMALEICGQYEKKLVMTGRNTGATGTEFANYVLETMQDPNLETRWRQASGVAA